MTLRLLGHIELPPNRSHDGFDHADVHRGTDRLYVAHTSNDAVDVIDTARDRYIESISGFTGVAGILVSEARGLVFTSNRGEDTVSVFAPGVEREGFKIEVGVKPNGLAFDAARGILIAANVGDPSIPDSHTVSIVSLTRRERIAEVKVPGRTRWHVLGNVGLSGVPDVIFLHQRPFRRLYVAVGDPGVIDVIDVEAMRREEVVTTEPGAHTLALDRKRDKVYAFLPKSHQAAVLHETV
jgi:hypothetical protein